VGENRYEARVPLAREGVLLGSVVLGRDARGEERMLALPPLALPYSPEFERSVDPKRGERLLRAVARESGGEVSPPLGTLLRGEREARTWRVVRRELVLAALLLLLLEIAARRLQLWGSLESALARLFGRWRAARGSAAMPASADGNAASLDTRPAAAPTPTIVPPAPTDAPKLDDALSKARRSARRELDR